MLTQDLLRKILHYDPETGVFTWSVSRGSVKKGKVAGAVSGRYRSITVRGKKYLAHRLAWLYVKGRFPARNLDHINRDRYDNRISNLREASPKTNARNSKIYANNTTGVRGVSLARGRFRAQIRVDQVKYDLGTFGTLQEAADKRGAIEADLFGFRTGMSCVEGMAACTKRGG